MMRIINYIDFILFTVVLLLGPVYLCLGQSQKLQVVTKTIEKQFSYTEGEELVLSAEKCVIKIRGWDKNEVRVVIRLISKALSQEVARKELAQLRYIAEKNGETLNLKNYFVLAPGKKKFDAILTASVELMVPRSMKMEITSKYGNMYMEGLRGRHQVNLEYGELQLRDVETSGSFKCYFGDLNVNEITGDAKFDLRHVKVNITAPGGILELDSYLGDITVVNPGTIESLKIMGTKSNILVHGVSTDSYYFNLKSEYGKIFLPDNSTTESSLRDWKKGSSSLPPFFLTTKFGDIKIIEK